MTRLVRPRPAGWLATAGLAVALVLPGAVLAQTGDPAPISSTGVSVDCSGGPGGSSITPGAGQVAWLFVHSGASHDAGGVLTAVYTTAGTKTATSYPQGGIKYLIVTDGPDTITSFSDTISGGRLVLSHVCYGATTSTSSTESPSASPSQPVGSESPSASPSQSPAASPAASASESPSPSPSEAPSGTVVFDPTFITSPSPTPVGTVLAATGLPQLTLPPTDTVGGAGSATADGQGLAILLLGLATTCLFAVRRPGVRRR